MIAVVERWSLTIRDGSRVDRAGFDTLDATLDALAGRLDALAPDARRDPVDVLTLHYDARRQVAVRAEIAGPGRRHGGVDLRGDGSSEAYTGRWRRTLIAPEPQESAVDALRRTLSDPGR